MKGVGELPQEALPRHSCVKYDIFVVNNPWYILSSIIFFHSLFEHIEL